jgi:hypothetical protein
MQFQIVNSILNLATFLELDLKKLGLSTVNKGFQAEWLANSLIFDAGARYQFKR